MTLCRSISEILLGQACTVASTTSEKLVKIIIDMDYDKTEIATTYDKARALAPETLRLWQDLLSVHVDRADMSLVIDLGCGTGRFSELLAAHFGVRVIGIDPSLKMLDQACRKPAIGNVAYCQGLAEALPFRDGCADLVFKEQPRRAQPHAGCVALRDQNESVRWFAKTQSLHRYSRTYSGDSDTAKDRHAILRNWFRP
jgi:SAM-dependent methyltransferase